MEETTNIEENQVDENLPGHEGVTTDKETKWYVLRVVSGKERKVKEYLDKDIVRNGWDKLIKQIFYLLKRFIKYRMVKR